MFCIIIVKFPKDYFVFCCVHQHVGDDVRWNPPIRDCNTFVYCTASFTKVVVQPSILQFLRKQRAFYLLISIFHFYYFHFHFLGTRRKVLSLSCGKYDVKSSKNIIGKCNLSFCSHFSITSRSFGSLNLYQLSWN